MNSLQRQFAAYSCIEVTATCIDVEVIASLSDEMSALAVNAIANGSHFDTCPARERGVFNFYGPVRAEDVIVLLGHR